MVGGDLQYFFLREVIDPGVRCVNYNPQTISDGLKRYIVTLDFSIEQHIDCH